MIQDIRLREFENKEAFNVSNFLGRAAPSRIRISRSATDARLFGQAIGARWEMCVAEGGHAADSCLSRPLRHENYSEHHGKFLLFPVLDTFIDRESRGTHTARKCQCRSNKYPQTSIYYCTNFARRRPYSASLIDPAFFNRSSLSISSAALKPTTLLKSLRAC